MSSDGRCDTRRRISDQKAVVAAMTPGTPQHRLASQILTMLEQMLETEAAIAKLKSKAKDDAPRR